MSASTQANQKNVPTKDDINALNIIREQYGIVSTEYSNIFSVLVDLQDSFGNYKTLGQSATELIGNSYRVTDDRTWSSLHGPFPIPTWRQIDDNGTTESRTLFAQAFTLVNYSTYGLLANAQYSDEVVTYGVGGGDANFAIYPVDMRYIANGPAPENNPGDGYSRALVDLRSAHLQKSIHFDFLNAASYFLYENGLRISGEKVVASYVTDHVLKSLTSEDYQKYLRAVARNEKDEIKNAATYFFNQELTTVAFLSNKSVTEVSVERQSTAISSILSDVYHGVTTYSPDPHFDTQISPYILTRFALSLGSSTNALLKNAAASLEIIIREMTVEKHLVAGITQNAAITDLFVILSGGSYLGQSESILLPPDAIDDAVAAATSRGVLTFTDETNSGQFVQALKDINSSGVFGVIGFVLNITRAAYDTLNLQYSESQDKLTPAQVIAVLARYFAVYGGIGSAKVFIKALNQVARKALLSAASVLRLDEVSQQNWASTGTFGTDINLAESIELATLNEATTALADNFSELPFAEESDFIATFFKSEVQGALDTIGGSNAENSMNLIESAVEHTAREIESISEGAIVHSSALVGARVLSHSFVIAGTISDVLFLVSDIVDISSTSKPTLSQILSISSDSLSLAGSTIGVGIAFSYLESIAFPPLAIALAVGSIIFGVSSTIITFENDTEALLEVRKTILKEFQHFESSGYLHDWGVKIQFLSAYSYLTAVDAKYTRWSPDDVSIFEDEAAAWKVFLETEGDTYVRFREAAPHLVNAKLNSILN